MNIVVMNASHQFVIRLSASLKHSFWTPHVNGETNFITINFQLETYKRKTLIHIWRNRLCCRYTVFGTCRYKFFICPFSINDFKLCIQTYLPKLNPSSDDTVCFSFVQKIILQDVQVNSKRQVLGVQQLV